MVKIKDLAKVDRPREKLIKYGPTKLTTSKLLAIIFRIGIKSMNVVELSRHILQTIGTDKLPDASFTELNKIKGLGNTKTSEIIAVIELGKRLLQEKKTNVLLSPQTVYDSLAQYRESKRNILLCCIWIPETKSLPAKLFLLGR